MPVAPLIRLRSAPAISVLMPSSFLTTPMAFVVEIAPDASASAGMLTVTVLACTREVESRRMSPASARMLAESSTSTDVLF